MGYLDLVGSFVYKQFISRAKLDALGENDQFLKNNGWQDSTKAVFFQASAPVGWTQDTSQNDKMLRVVSTIGGGVGGSHLVSTTISLQHTSHAVTVDNNHTHVMTDHTHSFNNVSGTGSGEFAKLGLDGSDRLRTFVSTGGAGTDTSVVNRFEQTTNNLVTGSGGSHDHGGATVNSRLSDIALAYVDVIICAKDTSVGYTDLTNSFNSNDKVVFELFDQLADNDEFNRLRITPFGSIMYFGQASVPTGWTQDTSQNGKALRIVNGAGGGSAGSFDFASTIVLEHDHSTLSNQAAHVHTFPNHAHRLADSTTYFASQGLLKFIIDNGVGVAMGIEGNATPATRTVNKGQTASDSGADTSADGSHDHATGSALTDIDLKHFDLIAGSKDSGGASSSYTDMTTSFANKKLFSKQRLNNMGANDDFLKFHTVESTSIMHFFQASPPLTWTLLTTQNDAGLRVVSGAGGGFAGTTGLSATLAFQHSHSLDSKGHSHTFFHTHPIPTASVGGVNVAGAGGVVALTSFSEMTAQFAIGSTNFLAGGQISSATPGGDTYNHDHGGITGNLLSDISLAFIDLIMCQKG